jgi:hypothetical protein
MHGLKISPGAGRTPRQGIYYRKGNAYVLKLVLRRQEHCKRSAAALKIVFLKRSAQAFRELFLKR